MPAQLTLGPLLFHWPADKWRDFYFRMADESCVDTVHLGEVVCSKRTPFTEDHYEDVTKRLQKAGKRVVFSTLAEVMIKRDRNIVKDICGLPEVMPGVMVEANDASALDHLAGKPHAIGPFMNVYNEGTLAFLAGKGATHVCLPPELPGSSMEPMGNEAKKRKVTLEAQVYGRLPLALSARCYHARAHGRIKDNCQFVCEESPDGMELKTMAGKPFLAINGIQTMSYTCLNLLHEMDGMAGMGIGAFRLSPHNQDMVKVASLFRAVLDRKIGAAEATKKLSATGTPAPFSNGFYHRVEGHRWIESETQQKKTSARA